MRRKEKSGGVKEWTLAVGYLKQQHQSAAVEEMEKETGDNVEC